MNDCMTIEKTFSIKMSRFTKRKTPQAKKDIGLFEWLNFEQS